MMFVLFQGLFHCLSFLFTLTRELLIGSLKVLRMKLLFLTDSWHDLSNISQTRRWKTCLLISTKSNFQMDWSDNTTEPSLTFISGTVYWNAIIRFHRETWHSLLCWCQIAHEIRENFLLASLRLAFHCYIKRTQPTNSDNQTHTHTHSLSHSLSIIVGQWQVL